MAPASAVPPGSSVDLPHQELGKTAASYTWGRIASLIGEIRALDYNTAGVVDLAIDLGFLPCSLSLLVAVEPCLCFPKG